MTITITITKKQAAFLFKVWTERWNREHPKEQYPLGGFTGMSNYFFKLYKEFK